MSKSHLLINSLALSSSLRAKGSIRSYYLLATGYLTWSGSRSVSGMGLNCEVLYCCRYYSNHDSTSSLRHRTSLLIWNKEVGSPLLATSYTSNANDLMCHVRGFTASSPCVCPSTHVGGIRVPTRTTCSCTHTSARTWRETARVWL